MKRQKQLSLLDTLRPPPDHWTWFEQFCRYEKWTGGPDPHMRAVVALCDGLDLEEQLWRAALYVGVYNVPTAEILWTLFPHPLEPADETGMAQRLDAIWSRLKLRRERRTVKSPARLARYMTGCAQTIARLPALEDATFRFVWDHAMSLPHVGRYAATKLTEIWHRLGLVAAEAPDICAYDGWSPRRALSLLFNDWTADEHSNVPTAIALADARAAEVRARLLDAALPLSWFELEVLLCEYKECVSTRRQYPGRSLDSELTYERAITEHWPERRLSAHLHVRPQLSPQWALGEHAGWDGVRDELGHVLADYGYVWSDAIYDYDRTTDFSNPARRSHVLGTEAVSTA